MRDYNKRRSVRRKAKQKNVRRTRIAITLSAMLLALALVLILPYAIGKLSLDAMIETNAHPPKALAGQAATSTPHPTRMPLWTPKPAVPTPAPTPTPTPEPTAEPTPVPAQEEPEATKAPSGKKMIALTFDDGPGTAATQRILDALDAVGGKATFFMLGENAKAHPTLAKRVADAGHQVGSHTNSHKSLIRLSSDALRKEVNLSLDNIEAATGVRPLTLRPPYGNANDSVKKTLDLPLINWSIDTLDWKSRDAKKVYAHILETVKDGDIVLMHDIYASTAQAVEKVLPKLDKMGFELVTIDELFEAKGLSLDSGTLYFSAKASK